MTAVIAATALLALVAGAITGFGKRWQESLLWSALVAPLVGSVVAAAFISWGWALLTFLWSFLAASITWGLAACVRHVVGKFIGAAATLAVLDAGT